MLKKLLSLFGGSKEEETPNVQSKVSHETHYSKEEDDDDDDEMDDDDDDVDDDDDDDETIVAMMNDKVAQLDPDTLHGKHYTVEDFDAEYEKRVAKMIKSEEEDGETVTESDIYSIRMNALDELYCDWNGFYQGHDAIINFRNRHMKKYFNQASYGFETMEANADNPLLEPIHGVSLEDYAAVSYKIASGADFNSIMGILGVDPAIWAEVSTLWGKRMAEDTTLTVTTLFGQFYNTADQHPKLNALQPEVSEKGKETLEKMKNDRFFYEELQGARTAAYEYGIDGAQWILDNYGVTLGDFQKVAAYHSEQDQKDHNSKKILEYTDYMSQKMEEYKKKFAEEQGGNIADDISF